jgi:hypothetical protein
MTVLDQKATFSARLKRIDSGRQYEPADVIGYQTQTKFNRMAARRPKSRRSFGEKMMILIAFLCGVGSVFAGRFAYFHLSRIEGLPDAFYDLGTRGMVLFALVIAGIFTVLLHLATRGRMQALLVGCALMHFGEAAIATNAQDLWSRIFSPEYAATLAEQGADYRVTPTQG